MNATNGVIRERNAAYEGLDEKFDRVSASLELQRHYNQRLQDDLSAKDDALREQNAAYDRLDEHFDRVNASFEQQVRSNQQLNATVDDLSAKVDDLSDFKERCCQAIVRGYKRLPGQDPGPVHSLDHVLRALEGLITQCLSMFHVNMKCQPTIEERDGTIATNQRQLEEAAEF